MAAKSLKDSKYATNGKKDSPFQSDSDNESSEDIECTYCNKTFLDSHSYEQHINSKKHYTQRMKKSMASKKSEIEKLDLGQSDSEDDDHSELCCEVCAKTFSGFKPYISHMRGSTHAKNQKKQDLKEKMKDVPGVESSGESDDGLLPKVVARCTLCNKEFSDLESFRKHRVSSTHKKKLQEQKIKETIKAERNSSGKEMEDDFYKTCEICDKEFSGIKPYHVHMKSSVHQRALKRNEMEEKIKDLCIKDDSNKFICKECKKPFTDPFSFQAHILNNSHKKYEAKSKIMDFVNSNPDIVAGKTVQNVFADVDEPDDYRVGDYILLCKLCHMSFTGPESAIDHVKSKKHLQTKYERDLKKFLRQKENGKAAAVEKGEKSKNALTDNSNKSSASNSNGNKNTNNDDFELL